MSLIYFDNAATSYPKPPAVLRAVGEVMRGEYGNPGRGGHRATLAAAERVYRCRAALAEMFGCSRPENVIFTANDTYALNLAIKGIARRGGRYLISSIEHNSVLRPVASLAERGCSYGIYRACTEASAASAELSGRLSRGDTVVCCHSSNICGITQPLGAIGSVCRSRAAWFIVDAAQSAGHIPIDMERDGIDILCSSGHKGLYGIGCGFLIVSPALDSMALRPLIEGGSGIASAELSMPETLPERLEAGTLCLPAIASLEAGIRFVREIGEEAIETHICGLGRRVRDMLLSLPGVRVYMPERVGGVVLFNVMGRGSEEVAAELDARGICVRAGLHCSPLAHKMLGTPEGGAVRASFGIYNTAEQTDRFYRAMKEITAQMK